MENTGERQVEKCFSRVRKDHRERYNLLLDMIEEGSSILDIGCGIGYGSYFLATLSPCSSIMGIDISTEAIEFARKNYWNSKTNFSVDNILETKLDKKFDMAVAYEIIEHINNSDKFLRNIYNLLEPNGLFIVSTPNEEVLKYSEKRFPFHVKHYRSEEFRELLHKAGFCIIKEFTQFTDFPIRGFGGRYNIAVCQKGHYEPLKDDLATKLDNCTLNAQLMAECINNGDTGLIEQLSSKLQQSIEKLTSCCKIKADEFLLQNSLSLFSNSQYQECINLILNKKLYESMKKAYFFVGSAYEKMEKYSEALSYFNKCEKYIDNLPAELRGALCYHIAFCLEKSNGSLREALKYYEACLTFIPDHNKARLGRDKISGIYNV